MGRTPHPHRVRDRGPSPDGWQTAGVIPYLVLALAAVMIALAIVVYVIWRRLGRSATARRWMGDGMFPRTSQERMTVLGWPALAGLCLCFALAALPVADGLLRIPAALLSIPLFLALLITQISAIPLPEGMYPHWARELRRQRRENRAKHGLRRV